MKKCLFLSVLFIASCFNSCDTDKSSSPVKINSKTQNINYAVHFSNPYDTVGRYHNEALEQIFTIYLKNSSSRANEQNVLKNLILDHLKNKPFNDAVIPEHEMEKYMFAISRSSNDSLPLSDKQRKAYNKLLYVIENDCGSSPQDLVSSINELEKEINDSDIVEEEKVGLLAMTSVAKYSSIYWLGKFEKLNEARLLARGSPVDPNFDYDRWYNESFYPAAESVIKADLMGALAGALWVVIFGGPIGIGYAAITLIMYGAVSGSISSSVCDGVGIIWDLVFEEDEYGE